MKQADEVKLRQAIAREVKKMVETTPRPPRSPVSEQLDGTGKPAEPGQQVVSTREAWCAQHGNYQDQQIALKIQDGDYKPYLLPYWVGCPKCREDWEAGNKAEARFLQSVNMLNRFR